MLYRTQDEAEWQAYVQHLRATDKSIDWTMVRVDTFCGRLVQPTTYRLSVFVPSPEQTDGGLAASDDWSGVWSPPMSDG